MVKRNNTIRYSTVFFLAIGLILSSCHKDSIKSNLVGQWRLDRIVFKTESVSSELTLGVSTKISAAINQDGSYTFEENGQVKSGHWTAKANGSVGFVHADNSSDDLIVTVTNGQLEVEALSIDLTKTEYSDVEINYYNLAKLSWITDGKDASGSTLLQVIFILKATP